MIRVNFLKNGDLFRMRNKNQFLGGLIFVLCAFSEVNAQNAVNPKTRKSPEAVLNFEGDVIEGEKRKPDLFMQSNVQNLDLDSILYIRNNFNDFHAVDSQRRPKHFRYKVKR